MSPFLSRRTAYLATVMTFVVIAAILVAVIYYRRTNSAVDPRVREARLLYAGYDRLAASGEFMALDSLLDSIESIYEGVSHYRNSFEIGVLCNNRAAMQLTIALNRQSVPDEKNPWAGYSQDTLIYMAQYNIDRAIQLYTSWLQVFGGLDLDQVEELIAPDFMPGTWEGDVSAERIARSRAKEISMALNETDRRLSVCYTNLGVIERTRGNYQEAIMNYEKALNLWDRNLEAENNLNRLLGRPIKKRNLLQKLFPPDRETKP